MTFHDDEQAIYLFVIPEELVSCGLKISFQRKSDQNLMLWRIPESS